MKEVGFGTQLVAPKAFDAFQEMVRYYYAGDSVEGKVHLAWFHKGPVEWRVILISMEREKFESLLTGAPPMLVKAAQQLSLPIWLERYQGINFEALESQRNQKFVKRTFRQQVKERELTIGPALEQRLQILSSTNPLRELGKIARRLRKHPHRVQLYFYVFVLHGDDIWALIKSRQETGRWNREDPKHSKTKFGAPSLNKQTRHNSPSAPCVSVIEDAFLEYCGESNSMVEIYNSFMTKRMGCKRVKDENGIDVWVNSNGGAILSYGQFRYRVVRQYGLKAVQLMVYGATRVRESSAMNQGNYTGQYARLLEGLEIDAKCCAQKPKAVLSDDTGEDLWVVRAYCARTGYAAGIGFSIASELEEAYRQALFFMVAPREYLAKMWSIPIAHLLDQLMTGAPPNYRSDRGAGGWRRVVSGNSGVVKIKSIPPPYEPQSHSLAESGHTREIQTKGAPTFRQSDKTVSKLMIQEIYRMMAENKSSNIANRLGDREIIELNRSGRPANPQSYCLYLQERLASAGQMMSLEQAVREFWTPFKFIVDKDGVHYRSRHFSSEALRNSGVVPSSDRARPRELDGYVFRSVFLSAWVEVKGHLIEVEPVVRARVDGEDLQITLSEAESVANELAELNSRTREVAAAARAGARLDFEEATGEKWSEGKLRRGRPKVTPTAAHEARVANLSGGGKS